jgi:glutathione S-transferase
MKTTLGLIENVWLKDTPYLTGDQITIADLLGVCEIEQPSEFLVFSTSYLSEVCVFALWCK